MLKVKNASSPSSETTHRYTQPPQDAVVVMTFGDELRWFEDQGRRVLYDQFSDNMLEGFKRKGLPTVQLTLNRISGTIPIELRESENLIELRNWHPDENREQILAELMATWRAWRGQAPNETRFPEYRGVSIDALLCETIESVLPYMVNKVADAHALAAFCKEYRPRAVIFTHFVTSQRHLIGPVRESGAMTIGPAIGCDSQDHLFYGIRDNEGRCPRADLYTVWGQRELDALERSLGPLNVPVLPSGRTRQDVFPSRQPSPCRDGWLQQLGLPADARRVIVFGDVLCSTNHAQILTSGSCEALLRGMLKAIARRPDVHIVYKPWRGDNLTEVRTVVGRIASPRVHIIDPDFVPFHNIDVLQHAVTVVSSPTSMLAEFASMGGLPIVLTLPETRYYHGNIIEEQFAPFSILVDRTDKIEAAVREAFEHHERVGRLDDAQRAALTHSFGEPDGKNADRMAEQILQKLEERAVSGSIATG